MIEKLTGANIGKKIVSVSIVLSLGISGVGIAEALKKNNDEVIDMNTKIEQIVFGPEIALKHLAINLQKQGAYNVVYHDSLDIETLPEGYLYINGKGVTFKNTIKKKEIIDGKEIITNTLPEGYDSITTKTGEIVGYKTIEPTTVSVGKCITFNMDTNGNKTEETLYWNEEKSKFERNTLTSSVEGDIVTYCNKKSISPDYYIFVQGTETEAKPVRYSEKSADSSDIYIKDEKEFVLNRIVTFYSNDDYKDLSNKFSGRLKRDEIMVFQSQENNTTTFFVYKQLIKKKMR